MKFFALAALVATVTAVDDASVANGAVCTADKECKVETDACCQTYADATEQTAAVAKATTKFCKAGIDAKQTVAPFMVTCKARVKGASSLAATAVAAAAAALYLL